MSRGDAGLQRCWSFRRAAIVNLNSAWAIVLHIHDIFFHLSLSDSKLQFNKLLNAQISAFFQTIECEMRPKIAAEASLIESLVSQIV